MKSERQYRGFSLTEVLLAVGTFAIGMIFVAGVFPVAIHFTTVATERTIAAVVTDEAFAKIRLYGGADLSWLSMLSSSDSNDFSDFVLIPPDELAYPSTDTDIMQKQYYWSALCRRVDPNSQLVQVTVFVSRKVGSGTMYVGPPGVRPVPIPVSVSQPATIRSDELFINDYAERIFFNDGYTIVDNETGQIYRVLERYADDIATPENEEQMILLDRNWQGGDVALPAGGWVWVVPPPISGGRYPCIAIYQKVIRF